MPALTPQGLDGWSRMANVWKKVFEVDPGFNYRSSALHTVFEAVAQGGPQLETNLQKALDGLPVEKAKKYRQVLKLLVDDYPNVCYTAVEEFTTASANMPQQSSNISDSDTNKRKVRYTSAEFKAKARVFCIVGQGAPTPFEVGFIQHCTSKSDVAEYTNGSKMREHCTKAMPVGDSAAGNHAPFYFRGKSYNCTADAYRVLAAGEATQDYEVGDYFDHNFQFYHPRPTPNTHTPGATLNKHRRDQAFSLWLVRRRGNTERLLRKVTYKILVDIAVGPGFKFTSSVAEVNVTNPALADQRPAVSSPTMNNCSQWQYCAPSSNNWVNV